MAPVFLRTFWRAAAFAALMLLTLPAGAEPLFHRAEKLGAGGSDQSGPRGGLHRNPSTDPGRLERSVLVCNRPQQPLSVGGKPPLSLSQWRQYQGLSGTTGLCRPGSYGIAVRAASAANPNVFVGGRSRRREPND